MGVQTQTNNNGGGTFLTLGMLLLLVAGLLGWCGVPPEITVPIISAWCLWYVSTELGRELPVIPIAVLIACLQLLVAPLYSYYAPPVFERYVMAVDKAVFFQFAVPATCAFLLALVASARQFPSLKEFRSKLDGPDVYQWGLLLIFLGFLSGFIGARGPDSLGFAFFLGTELKFVGALYCYYNRKDRNQIVFVVVVGLAILSALTNAMFHQLLLWGAVFFGLALSRLNRRLPPSVVGLWIVCGLAAVVWLDSYKSVYRERRHDHPEEYVSETVSAMITGKQVAEKRASQKVVNVRLNQGWILSNVMRHVPAHEPFAHGQTIVTACIDAVLPRFLAPNKSVAGGRAAFRRFTGLKISNSTSMGIGVHGDAYANFGVIGGVLTMGVYGVLLAAVYSGLMRHAVRYPLFLFWIPLVFSQAIKVETEFSVVLNHLMKASIFSLVGFYLLRAYVHVGARRSRTPQRRVARIKRVDAN